jgi:DNA-binding NarL/FixJ family response regulator
VRRIRIVVIDDHPVFAGALKARLSAEPDMEVVGTATNSREALSLVEAVRPDLVTLDIQLGREDGLTLCEPMRESVPTLLIVAVTCVVDTARAMEAVRAGVRGWAAKDGSTHSLLAAIRGAAVGESWFPPGLLGRMLPELVRTSGATSVDARLRKLTKREFEILQCMVDGLDRRRIANRLVLSVNTVRTHAQSMLAKLGVHSSLEAVAVARAAGMRSDSDQHRGAASRPPHTARR